MSKLIKVVCFAGGLGLLSVSVAEAQTATNTPTPTKTPTATWTRTFTPTAADTPTTIPTPTVGGGEGQQTHVTYLEMDNGPNRPTQNPVVKTPGVCRLYFFDNILYYLCPGATPKAL